MSNLMSNMSTTLGLTKDPVKYEQRALAYEQKGKMAKAQKNRDKALRLRQQQASGQTSGSGYSNPLKNPERYDQKALKWQNKGNMQKAEKNRQKAARLRAEQATRGGAAPLGTTAAYPVGTTGFNTAGTTGFNTAGATNTMNTGLATQTVVAPPIVEQVMRPTVIEQTTRPERIVEVQPVVHREIEQPQVHVVEKHSYESVPSAGPAVINRQAIVQETVRPRVIEEVQPVIHREVPAPFVERVEQHVTEHIVQPTVVTKDVLNNAPAARAGVAAGGLPPNSNANTNLPQQQQRRL